MTLGIDTTACVCKPRVVRNQSNRPQPFGLRPRLLTSTRILLVFAAVALCGLFVLARSSQQERQTAERPAPTMQPTTRLALHADDGGPPANIGDAPLLGEQVDLWLFYGGDDQLQRLDLDTGQVENFGMRALPIHAVKNELILSTPDQGLVGRVGLYDPGEQAHGWYEARVGATVLADELWMYTPDDQVWTRHDTTTDRIGARRDAPGLIIPGRRADHQHPLIPGPDLITTASGVYGFGDTGISDTGFGDSQYVRHKVGRLIASLDDRALVETCSEVLTSCTTRWFNRDDWLPTNHPAPENAVASAALLGADSWLHVLGLDGSSQLFSTTSAVTVSLDPSLISISVSPDGRWLASLTANYELQFHDLTTGELTHRMEPFEAERGGTLLFVAIETDS